MRFLGKTRDAPYRGIICRVILTAHSTKLGDQTTVRNLNLTSALFATLRDLVPGQMSTSFPAISFPAP